jgi:hypothetical protein
LFGLGWYAGHYEAAKLLPCFFCGIRVWVAIYVRLPIWGMGI